MDMQEAVGESMGMASSNQVPINKGRRTKRLRPSSPFSLASSSSSDGGRGGGSSSISFGTEEEEDMANCLILLAGGNHKNGNKKIETAASRWKNGLYVYECKTCNRCFPSFQALGGHRASHKKPKAVVNDQGKKAGDGDVGQQINSSSSTTGVLVQDNKVSSSQHTNNKPSKVHECSICGSEFSSGQALGGHMRRHRRATTANTLTHNIAPVHEHDRARNLLALDLNLPAPEEDVGESNISFSSRQQQPLIFSSSPMVDCHY